MPLLPEQISTRTLRRRWRGYDREQVEELLARVAADYTGAIERIAHEATQPPETLARARAEAATEAAAIHARADHTADTIIARAEQAAQALTRQAETLRTQAQTDADTARARLEQADTRAHHQDHDARQRWEALRTAEHELQTRVHHFEQTLARLRDKITLLDQISETEDALATIRAQAHPEAPHHNGTSPDAALTADTSAGEVS